MQLVTDRGQTFQTRRTDRSAVCGKALQPVPRMAIWQHCLGKFSTVTNPLKGRDVNWFTLGHPRLTYIFNF